MVGVVGGGTPPPDVGVVGGDAGVGTTSMGDVGLPPAGLSTGLAVVRAAVGAPDEAEAADGGVVVAGRPDDGECVAFDDGGGGGGDGDGDDDDASANSPHVPTFSHPRSTTVCVTVPSLDVLDHAGPKLLQKRDIAPSLHLYTIPPTWSGGNVIDTTSRDAYRPPST